VLLGFKKSLLMLQDNTTLDIPASEFQRADIYFCPEMELLLALSTLFSAWVVEHFVKLTTHGFRSDWIEVYGFAAAKHALGID
jgi:hypothetical protein